MLNGAGKGVIDSGTEGRAGNRKRASIYFLSGKILISVHASH